MTFTIGSEDGGWDTYSVTEGTTWQEFADSGVTATCEDCGEDYSVVEISDEAVYCGCVIHTGEGVRYCTNCYGESADIFYVDDNGDVIYVNGPDTIEARDYFCHTIDYYV